MKRIATLLGALCALLFAAPAWAALGAPASLASGSKAGTDAFLTVTTSTTVPSGSTIVGVITIHSASHATSPVVTTPNGGDTCTTHAETASGANHSMWWFDCYTPTGITSGGSITVTFSNATGNKTIAMVYFTGQGTVEASGGAGTSSGSSTSLTITTSSPVTNDARVFAFASLQLQSGGAFGSVDPNWTSALFASIGTTGSSAGASTGAYRTVTDNGAVTWTRGYTPATLTMQNWAIFYDASGGPPPISNRRSLLGVGK